MLDFYYNTSLNWFLRTTDDVFISIDNLYKLIYDLEQNYNPENETVVRGHSIKLTEEEFFIHGGPGWLMSRASVREMINIEQSHPFTTSNLVADDVIISKYWNLMQINSSNSFSSQFAGNRIIYDQQYIMLDLIFNKLLTCPNEHQLIDPKNIAVWHSSDRELAVILRGDKFIKVAPKNIRLYFKNSFLHFCKI